MERSEQSERSAGSSEFGTSGGGSEFSSGASGGTGGSSGGFEAGSAEGGFRTGGSASSGRPDGFEGSGGSAGSRGSSGSGRGFNAQTRNVFAQVKDKAEDGWGWARKNPWPVVGAAIGIGLLLAWRRRGNADHRLAHMDSHHPVGHTRGFSVGTDEVAEGMGRSAR